MSNTIESKYEYLLNILPDISDDDVGCYLNKENLPVPDDVMTTKNIVIKKGLRDYNSSFRPDYIIMDMQKTTSRILGLYFLSCIFHKQDCLCKLELSHNESHI